MDKEKQDYEEKNISIGETSEVHGCKADGVEKNIAKQDWNGRDRRPGAERILSEHRRLWERLRKKLSEGLDISDEKGISDEKELKLTKVIVDALLTVTKGEKEAWGLDDVFKDSTDLFDITGEMEHSTIPSGTDETMDGE